MSRMPVIKILGRKSGRSLGRTRCPLGEPRPQPDLLICALPRLGSPPPTPSPPPQSPPLPARRPSLPSLTTSPDSTRRTVRLSSSTVLLRCALPRLDSPPPSQSPRPTPPPPSTSNDALLSPSMHRLRHLTVQPYQPGVMILLRQSWPLALQPSVHFWVYIVAFATIYRPDVED